MRVLLLHHPYTRTRFEQDFVDRVAALGEFEVAAADLDALAVGKLASVAGPSELSRYDAVVLFVAFSRLRAAEPIDWRGYDGLRVLLEHDAIQSYSDLFDPTLKGAWPRPSSRAASRTSRASARGSRPSAASTAVARSPSARWSKRACRSCDSRRRPIPSSAPRSRGTSPASRSPPTSRRRSSGGAS
jgi:hypothetical protein